LLLATAGFDRFFLLDGGKKSWIDMSFKLSVIFVSTGELLAA